MIWIIAILLIASVLINRFYLKKSLERVYYFFSLSKYTAEPGESIQAYSVLENRKRLSVPYIDVQEIYDKNFPMMNYRFITHLSKNQRVTRVHELKTERRGRYEFANFQITLGDFLGLSQHSLTTNIHRELVILPKKLSLREVLVPHGTSMGDITVKRWILPDPQFITGVREYSGLEPLRQIHWKSTARRNQLMVKNYDFTTEAQVLLLVNVETSKPSWEQPDSALIEAMIITARSIMEELEASSIPFGLLTNAYNYKEPLERSMHLPSGLGDAHLAYGLEILGRMDYKVGLRFHTMLQTSLQDKSSFTSFVLLLPVVLDEYVEAINSLTRYVSKVILISASGKNLDRLMPAIEVYRGGPHA